MPREQDPGSNAIPATVVGTPSGRSPVLGRRRWLLGTGVASGAGLLVGGAVLGYDRYQRFGSAGAAIRDHRVQVPAGTPRLVIARGQDPARNVTAALGRLGGMAKFVSQGDVVLIKPNMAWDRVPAQAGNTEPRVVAALVRACRDAGAREVLVTDCPVQDAARTFQRSGVEAAARDAGARVVLPASTQTQPVELSKRLGNWPVLEPFIAVDKIINVPVAKHHGSARVTAGMKNWIGVTPHQRSRFHAALDQTIAELAQLMKPTLTVVDAHRILMRNGPRGGNLDDVKEEAALAMSIDPVAVDAWACELLGTPVDEVGYLALAAGLGLGTADWRRLGPVQVAT